MKVSLQDSSLLPSERKEAGWLKRVVSWLPGILLLSGFLLLLLSVVGQSHRERTEQLNALLAETREASRELEGLLGRLTRELGHYSSGEGAEPASGADSLTSPQGRISALAWHLHDLESALVGLLHLDADGSVVAASPAMLEKGPVPDSLAALPAFSDVHEEARVHTGLWLSDGRPAVALSRPLGGVGNAFSGWLVAVVSLDDLTPHLLGSGPRPEGETFMILDDWGHLLVHPVREWIGYLLLSRADSLYDPELHRVLPEVLGDEAGAWNLVSEALASDAWTYGASSAFAVAPLKIPGGGMWKVGLARRHETGFLLGLPSRVQMQIGTFLAAMLLLGLGMLLQFGAWNQWKLRRLRDQRDWLQAMLEAGADGALILRGRRGPVVAANPELCRLLNRSMEELLGTPWGELREKAGPESFPAAGDIPLGRFEARLQGGKGSPAEVEISAGTFSHQDQEYVVALVRDLGWRRDLERETLRVGERERLLLGKELHDGLGQHLTGVAFMAKTLASKLVSRHAAEAEDAEGIGQLVKDAVGQIRVLSKGMELSEYEGHELPQALEEMSSVVSRLMGVSMELDLDPGLENGDLKPDRSQATQLYRVCHDVVSDAVRNRMAQKVRIQIRKAEGEVLLSVQHNGALQSQERGGAASLLSYRLRYRARLLDAALDMHENPEGVTTVLCSFKVDGDQG